MKYNKHHIVGFCHFLFLIIIAIMKILKSVWKNILQFLITVLTALATSFGAISFYIQYIPA